MAGDRGELIGAQRLTGVVYLEVAKAEVREALEGLRARSHDVGEGQIRPLRPVQRRYLAVGVEQVANPPRDGLARIAAAECHQRASRIDRAEVGHHRAARQPVHADGRYLVLLYTRALRIQGGEGRRARWPEDRRPGPGRVVESGLGPTRRMRAAVDPFNEVAAVGVALWRREPLRRQLAPRSVAAVHDVSPVVVPERQLHQQPGRRGGASLASAVPPVEDTQCVRPARPDDRCDVDGPGVLLVRVAEARPRIDLRTVHREPIGVRGRNVCRGAAQPTSRRRHVRAQIRDPVRLCGRPGRPEPQRRPVRLPRRRRERHGRRDRAPPRRPHSPGLRRPRVGGVAGKGRPAVEHEGLLRAWHRAAVPDDTGMAGIGPSYHDPVPVLHRAARPRLQGPCEMAIVRVDAHSGGQAVDRQRARPQRPTGDRRDARVQHATPLEQRAARRSAVGFGERTGGDSPRGQRHARAQEGPTTERGTVGAHRILTTEPVAASL